MFNKFNINDIINTYLNITINNKRISTLGTPFNYKLGSELNTNLVSRKNILYIDIKRAGPTILNIFLGKDNELVQKVNSISDKKERSKLITISLKYNKYDINIRDLLIWQKILILGYCYSLYDNINILEYNNDGVIFTYHNKINTTNNLLSFIKDNNVEYNFQNISEYYYINNNSYICDENNNVNIHGIYKNIPQYFTEYIIPNILINKDIYNKEIINNINEKYNKIFYKILIELHDINSLNKYYGFLSDNTYRYLTYNNKFTYNYKDINIEEYKRNIIYPMILLNRLNFKN